MPPFIPKTGEEATPPVPRYHFDWNLGPDVWETLREYGAVLVGAHRTHRLPSPCFSQYSRTPFLRHSCVYRSHFLESLPFQRRPKPDTASAELHRLAYVRYLLHAPVDRRSWGGSRLMHVIRTDETSGQFPVWVPHRCPLMAQLLPSQGMLWSDRHAAFTLPLLAATLHLDGLCVCLCLAVARPVFRRELSWPRAPAAWLATFGLLPRLASLLWLPWNFFRRWHCLFAASPHEESSTAVMRECSVPPDRTECVHTVARTLQGEVALCKSRATLRSLPFLRFGPPHAIIGQADADSSSFLSALACSVGTEVLFTSHSGFEQRKRKKCGPSRKRPLQAPGILLRKARLRHGRLLFSMITVLKRVNTESDCQAGQPRRLVSSHFSLPSRGVQILAIFGGLWSVVCGSSDSSGPFLLSPLVGGGFGLCGYPHGVHQA